jgi:hypothetical protein
MGTIINLKRRFDMSTSKFVVIATLMLLSLGLFLYPQGPANAARYCAQLRGATGRPNCSFSTLHACHSHVTRRGGGHCYKSR